MAYQSVAGQFFPEDKIEQAEMVKKFLEAAKEVKIPGAVKGIVVPHAGWTYSGIVAGAGYNMLSKNYSSNNKIILVGPSHREYFAGIKEEICDHSVEVQLPFLKEIAPLAKVQPIVYGEIELKDLAQKIEQKLDKNTIIIVSSDLSHYYPYEMARKIDSAANKFIPELNLDKIENEVEACGKTGIMALILLAKKFGWKGILLDYQNSGDTAGDKSSVVGYGCYGFYE